MKQTIVAVFDRYSTAQHAAHALMLRGEFSEDQLHVSHANLDDVDAPEAAARGAGPLAHFRSLLAEAFGPEIDHRIAAYGEKLHEDAALLQVDVEQDLQRDVAHALLEEEGALDIEVHAQGPDLTSIATTTTPSALDSVEISALDRARPPGVS